MKLDTKVLVALTMGSLTLTSCQSNRSDMTSTTLKSKLDRKSTRIANYSPAPQILTLNYAFEGQYFPQFDHILNRTKDYSKPYSIVVFKHLQTDATIEKNQNICEALSASYPYSEVRKVEKYHEILWPIRDSKIDYLFGGSEGEFDCFYALKKYDLWQSQLVLNDAKAAGLNLKGSGPFIITWPNMFDRGKLDTPVQYLDFSNVQTSNQALELMEVWRNRVSQPVSEWERKISSAEYWMNIKFRYENFFLPLERRF